MSEDQIGVAGRLKLAREQAGLTQGQAAKIMDMHRPTISEIEAGRRRVQADEVAAFAKIYKVDPQWILGDEGVREDAGGARVRLAARELAKLKSGDLDRVMKLLASLRTEAESKGKKK